MLYASPISVLNNIKQFFRICSAVKNVIENLICKSNCSSQKLIKIYKTLHSIDRKQ